MTTWWIDEPILLGSSNPTEAELGALAVEGFSIVVSLLREDEQEPNYDQRNFDSLGYTYYPIPVRDFTAPAQEQMQEFVDLVEENAGRTKILVHCWGGSGRTGTMAAAYLISRGFTLRDAVERVRAARPTAIETEGQMDALRTWAGGAAGGSSPVGISSE